MKYGVLVVGLFALLAGCSLAGPAPSDGNTAEFNVTNFESTAATVELHVATDSVESLDVQYANGTTQTVVPPYIGDQGELRSAIIELENVSTVTPTGAEIQTLIEASPSASTTGEVAVPQGATVVLVGRVEGSVVAVGIMQCGTNERINQIAFVIGGYGPLIGGGCQAT